MRRARALADPFATSLLVHLAALVLGVAALGLAWTGTKESADVAEQIAYVVSGGFGGIALIGFASGVFAIEARRWAEARRRAEFDRVIEEAVDLLAVVRAEAVR